MFVCNKCDKWISEGDVQSLKGTQLARGPRGLAFKYCGNCFENLKILIAEYIQPERSKREDSHKCEMRCSEHCSNAVRDK